MQVPLNFDPRDYQCEALAALDAGSTMNVWCWSRRGGKDFTAFGYAVKKMVESPMNVVLVFPTKEQGKRSFWNNTENDGFKTIEHIPAALVESRDNGNMRIVLKNGSVFEVMGATDPDALRGANAKLYIFSEFVDIPSAALDVIRPIIAVNGGQIIVQSTPKIDGISGGTFKLLFDRAKKNPKSYASRITANRYLSVEALEEIRQDTIAKNGNDFWFKQEFMCDWGQASSTSYYGVILEAMEAGGKIGELAYNSKYPVYTAWDLGMSDSTAITFFQYYDKKVFIIDYYETHNIGLEPIVKFVMSKPYNMAWHFLPHDGTVRDSDAEQRLHKAQDYGLINSSTLKREPREDGIQRVIGGINTIENGVTKRVVGGLDDSFMSAVNTEDMRRKLMLYKRKFNGLTGDYLGPEHKTESHAADSIRYVWVAIDQEFDAKTGSFYYDPANAQSSYESDMVTTPQSYRR
jgi:phage terminase large subunit